MYSHDVGVNTACACVPRTYVHVCVCVCVSVCVEGAQRSSVKWGKNECDRVCVWWRGG